MSEVTDGHLKEAAKRWLSGRPLEAGQLLFENLPLALRPKWATRILKEVVAYFRIRSEPIDQLLSIADKPGEWRQAHRVFDTLRDAGGSIAESPVDAKERDLLYYFLPLAENVARVLYNATNPDDEFDEDSGWWIASNLRDIVDRFDDAEFSKCAWHALSSMDE
jgi:hypothetical protein